MDAGARLGGTTTLAGTGTFDWTGGTIEGNLTIAHGVTLHAAGAHTGNTTQNSQLALSAFWAALGFTSLVAGFARDKRPLRLAGLALLGLAVGKVFIVDLAALESIWRVASFLGLGLLLLAAAFGYQRARSGAGSA